MAFEIYRFSLDFFVVTEEEIRISIRRKMAVASHSTKREWHIHQSPMFCSMFSGVM